MAVFVDPKTGERYENVPDAEAERARTEFGLVDADAFDRQQVIDAKPLGQKAIETAATVGAGVASIGNVIGDVIPESLGGLSDAEVQQFNTEFSGSPLVKGLKEEHPIAFALGSSAPAIALGPAVGAAAGGGLAGGVAGTLAESAAVGLGDEAIASGAEGREFDEGRAVEGAGVDLAFSAAAQALLGVAGRVGNLFLFGGGNTMAKNVGRGLDETVGTVVPDDIRFESPLLEAETRSTRAAAAASPGMPPGPARDEALRRAASDLNEQVRTQGGETLETTVAEAQKSASVADSPVVQRRIDEILTETTPAQTSWSADATQRLDKMRQAVAADPAAARAVAVADEAIRAIDGASDSAEWFKASAAARDRLDAIADAMPESPVAKTIADARDWLGKSLADRGMWGTAADLDASLRGAARDKVATAARTVGGDLRGHVAAYVDADGAGRAGLRAPIDQAIEGVEELAAAHERFGTATPKQIETLKENAAGLRRRIALADDVRAAEGRAAKQVAEETPAKATMVEQAAEAVARHLKKDGKAALSAGIGRALTTIADFAGIPGAGWVVRKIRGKVGDAVADQVIAAAKKYDPASPGAKRVRRIMDRMRARERQAGAVTLKVGKGWTPKSESDQLVDDAIRSFDDDEVLAEMSKADLRQYIAERADEAWEAKYPEVDEIPAAVLKANRASAKAAVDNIDDLKASISRAVREKKAAFDAAVVEALPDMDRAIELLKKDPGGMALRNELGGIKANTIINALRLNGAVTMSPSVPGRGSRYHPTDKAREIIERMRAAERQRGSVTLGGKKRVPAATTLENGMTEAEYEAKLAALRAKRAARAEPKVQAPAPVEKPAVGATSPPKALSDLFPDAGQKSQQFQNMVQIAENIPAKSLTMDMMTRLAERAQKELPDIAEYGEFMGRVSDFFDNPGIKAGAGEVDYTAKQTMGAGGKTRGGMYVGSDGVERYVKFLDKEEALSEAANAAAYADFGVGNLPLEVAEQGGETLLMSKRLPGREWKRIDQHMNFAKPTKELVDEYVAGVPADFVLGNWDIAGNGGNIMTDGRRMLRIDAGEAGPRSLTSFDAKEEWNNFRASFYEATRKHLEENPRGIRGPIDIAPLAGASFDEIKATLKNGIGKVEAAFQKAGGIKEYVDSRYSHLKPAQKKTLADRFKARLKFLSENQDGFVQLAASAQHVQTVMRRAAEAARMVAASPLGAVLGMGGVAAAGHYAVNRLRADEKADDDLETADRVIAVDDAAQQRVHHTARVLAGLAEPPPAEGLTTALGRFGADYEDPRAAFEERKSILEKAATAPTLVYDVIGSALGDVARVSPELFQAASQRLLDGFQYLRENLPAEVKTTMLYPTGVPPSESAMRDWATQWNTVMDPESVLDDVERGTVSHLQIRTLEGAHPDIYQSMRTEVIAEVGANFQDIPWSTKMSLDLLFQADGLAGPAFSSKAAAMIGEAMQNASQRKAPGPVDPSAGDAAADGPSGLESIKTSVTNRGA